MRLYLVRHGEAKPKEADSARHLTSRGAAEVRKVAAFLKGKRLAVAGVWHSGKTRAEQTAEIIAEALKVPEKVREQPGLAPNDPVKPVVQQVLLAGQDLMIVGHMPFLGKLASVLLAGNESVEAVSFGLSGVACLQRDKQGRWALLWLVGPEMLP
jgi:phosphohistidine phosphatase